MCTAPNCTELQQYNDVLQNVATYHYSLSSLDSCSTNLLQAIAESYTLYSSCIFDVKLSQANWCHIQVL